MTWEDAWREGRTRWDAGAAAPALVDLLEAGTLPKGRALVPGAGSGYDVLALAGAGFDATGLDLAPTALKRFEELRAEAGLGEDEARVVLGDFFAYQPPQPFDVIWDYTFLCAIQPSQRPAWVETMAGLLAPQGELVTLIFPVNPDDPTPSTDEDAGPPFRMHPEVVKTLVSGHFELIELVTVTRSHPGREGKEFLARWRHA